MAIHFFAEDVAYKLPRPRKTSQWIKAVILKEKGVLSEINYIFCSDQYLLDLNLEYLRHNTLTDIITFDYSDRKKGIAGDIFISTERVEENARKFARPFDEELHRVLVHGVLHLLGYKDKKTADKALMRKKEEAYLSLRK